MLNNENDVIKLIEQDDWMMMILEAAKQLNLPDWWVCAGFVRSKILDTLHHFTERTPIPDIDVVYFHKTDIEESTEKILEERLKGILPGVPWSVKNEARMHLASNVEPYTSSVDAISRFPETATALGVKLDEHNHVMLTAPCGLADVLNLEIKPTPYFAKHKELSNIYHSRLLKKKWKAKWNKIKIYPI